VLPVRRLAKNGFEAWSEVIAHDCQGLGAKDEASLYEAGPTRRWLKVKQQGWTDAHQVRTGDQSEDRQGARPHHPSIAAAAGG